MSIDAQTPIEGWAILDLFGHNHIAGYLRTVMVGTSGMFRVDIPEEAGQPAYTRFYSPGAVYSLTLVTEALAREALQAIRPDAVTVYIPRQLPRPHGQPEGYDEDEDREWHND